MVVVSCLLQSKLLNIKHHLGILITKRSLIQLNAIKSNRTFAQNPEKNLHAKNNFYTQKNIIT